MVIRKRECWSIFILILAMTGNVRYWDGLAIKDAYVVLEQIPQQSEDRYVILIINST